MTSSADLPEGFLAEVFRAGCQCDHCAKWKAEIARLREENAMLVEGRKSADAAVPKLAQELYRLREAIRRFVTIADKLENDASDHRDWSEYHAAVDAQREIAREGK